jgi:uncharacterized protein YheU (UPF0270 family)
MSSEDEAAEPIEVPASELSPEVLTALIEAFVLREGTDYGAVERSFASKVADVRVQLARGEAKITFEPASESIGIARVR